MDRQYVVGQRVIFVDPKGIKHDALVTIWWSYAEYRAENGEPGCNLVYVSDDADRSDQYGRQIERATSVVHRSKQPAHGHYWCWPDEVEV